MSNSNLSLSLTSKVEIAGETVQLSCDYQEGGPYEFNCPISLPIEKLIEELQTLVPADLRLPGVLAGLTIEELGVSFQKESGESTAQTFTFFCRSKFCFHGKEKVDIIATIKHTPAVKNTPAVWEFGGHIGVDVKKDEPLKFDLQFAPDEDSEVLVATYSHGGGDHPLNLGDLIRGVAGSDLASSLLDELTIDLKDALFAYKSPKSNGQQESKFLFGLDIGADIKLSNLPLVGQEFPPDQTLAVDDLQLLFASQAFDGDDVKAFNDLLPEGVTQLPVPQKPDSGPAEDGNDSNDGQNDQPAVALGEGLSLSAIMKLADTTETLVLSAAGANGREAGVDQSQPEAPAARDLAVITSEQAMAPAAGPSDNAKWFKIQKSFGPVHFERVGFQYQDQAVWFLLDAALSAAGLTLSLDGLSFGSSLTRFDPRFDLHGLGIAYQSGPVEIGGAFLRVLVEKEGANYEEYDGAAVLKTKALTLSAIGSYAYLQGQPSLFIYAVLDYPLGGPSFFFVTGLAAGFGYNRALIMPPIEGVAQFPLVEEAMAGSAGGGNGTPGAPASAQSEAEKLTGELEKLRDYLPPATGQYFLAVGIKFNSFKMIDSFALLAVAFGEHFEIDVLGLSTMILPTPEAGQEVTPLAKVQMALKATFDPGRGFLGVQAQLTSDSYILSGDCHLTGGFAFFTWFSGEHAGDFVTTLGGYHPAFQVPAHYPQVPRLGFNWQVDDHLSLKGDAYFALTPTALMAGGHLEATWHSGNLKAWFIAGADFLIAWKPYHYDARVYVDMGVSYTFHFFGTHHISVGLGADLHIWGPEFAGTAHIHLWIISFDVSFGPGGRQAPQPIDWDTFKESFLPEPEQVCTIAVQEGLVRKIGQDDDNLGVINPKELVLATNSVIPSKSARSSAETVEVDGANTEFGIGSMGVAPANLCSTHTITISRDGDGNVETEFEFRPILKNVPAGLWGERLTPELSQDALINNALSGFEIRPGALPEPGETHAIDRSSLSYETECVEGAYCWQELPQFKPSSLEETARRKKIKDSIEQVKGRRESLLKVLGVSEEIDVGQSIADDFLIAPQIEES